MSELDIRHKLWATPPAEPFSISLDEVRRRARKFQSRIRMRNFTEYAAAAVVIGAFTWVGVLIPEPVVRLGAALLVLGTLYVCWKLHTMARAASEAEIGRSASLMEFHRTELVRQRDAVASVWRWYLAPFAPGALIFVAGALFSPDTGLPFLAQLPVFLSSLAIMGGVAAAVILLNTRAARQLDEEIAALDEAMAGGD